MAEIGFYHLLSTPLERALPRPLERARAQGNPVVRQRGLLAAARKRWRNARAAGHDLTYWQQTAAE